MEALGRLLTIVGFIVFGVAAVMRRMLSPEDFVNVGVGRSIILVVMLFAGSLLVAGHFARQSGRRA